MNIDEEIMKAYESEGIPTPPRREAIPTVTIPLNEYAMLTIKSYALDCVLEEIEGSLELNYSGEALRLADREEIAKVYKTLYPHDYKEIFKKLKEEGE